MNIFFKSKQSETGRIKIHFPLSFHQQEVTLAMKKIKKFFWQAIMIAPTVISQDSMREYFKALIDDTP